MSKRKLKFKVGDKVVKAFMPEITGEVVAVDTIRAFPYNVQFPNCKSWFGDYELVKAEPDPSEILPMDDVSKGA